MDNGATPRKTRYEVDGSSSAELLLRDPELNVIRDANSISSNAALLDKISQPSEIEQ